MLLRLYGHEVDTALSGTSAMHAAQARPPEVVLLDISMPGMDGFEVARELRRMFGQRLLIVAVTALGSGGSRAVHGSRIRPLLPQAGRSGRSSPFCCPTSEDRYEFDPT